MCVCVCVCVFEGGGGGGGWGGGGGGGVVVGGGGGVVVGELKSLISVSDRFAVYSIDLGERRRRSKNNIKVTVVQGFYPLRFSVAAGRVPRVLK